MEKFDVVIIGAGVVGGMLARELSRYALSVCLLEAENDVACGASKANSGIIHGGFDPEPGTLKAKLNAEGIGLLYEAADALHVPYRKNGSLVCAFTQEEAALLQALHRRGIENGAPETVILTGDEARRLEPALSEKVTAALHAPEAGIICPYSLTIAAVGNAMDNGVALRRNFRVCAVSREEDGFTVTAENGRCVSARFLVNCAGAYADRVAAMAGDDSFRIIPRAGEYLLLEKECGDLVKSTVFQVPTRAGKGILVSPTAHGNLLLGPTAAEVDSPEGKDTTAAGLETVRKLSAKSVPSVDPRRVITAFTGVRASTAGGDFIIRPSGDAPGLLHAAAIDSPGLTASIAIARCCVKLLGDMGLSLREKEHWDGTRPDPHAFRSMDEAAQDAFIREHPDYGRIVCRCEVVSEGEIRAAIRQNPGALDVDGVKRRTRSGMGRCQGGFCTPTILEILAQELGVPMECVTKNGEGSEYLQEVRL